MFDVGMSEVFVIALVALIVLGPEKLPKAARMLGTFMRKARSSFDSLKQEVEREIEADALRSALRDVPGQLRDVENQIRAPIEQLQHDIAGTTPATATPEADPAALATNPAAPALGPAAPALDAAVER